MRADMFKVIVERPRRGGRGEQGGRGRLAGEDDLPVKIGMNRHVALTGRDCKALNENLQPLKRYLGKQVGRPWNKIYSEISAHLAPGHTVKEHVRQHLRDFVMHRVAIGRDGEWLDGSARSFGRRTLPWYQALYVDPRDGILKDSAKLWKKLNIGAKPWRWRKPEADTDVMKRDATHELRRIDGVWYEITYDRKPDAPPEATVFDLLKRTRVSIRTHHAAAKRQLSGSELKAHGLSNL